MYNITSNCYNIIHIITIQIINIYIFEESILKIKKLLYKNVGRDLIVKL